MVILSWSDALHPARVRIVALFGLGLIGASVRSALVKSFHPSETLLPFSWTDGTARSEHAAAIYQTLRQIAAGAHQLEISIVWTAGRAGFSADVASFDQEMPAFDAVLRMATAALDLPGVARVAFHLASSAGGLFEGQVGVDTRSVAAPTRPYGWHKLAQEAKLETLDASVARHVYRPSAVYGQGDPNWRAGLPVVLLRNSLNNKTTRLFGKPDTLRDYVLNDDIGSFIRQKIEGADADRSGTYILATGKPTSMTEMIARIERMIERRLYVQYEAGDNASDNTFSRSALPVGWQSTGLEFGLHRTFGLIRRNFSAVRLGA